VFLKSERLFGSFNFFIISSEITWMPLKYKSFLPQFSKFKAISLSIAIREEEHRSKRLQATHTGSDLLAN
jgi:hypothetical protein